MAIRRAAAKITVPKRPRWQSRHHGVRMSEEAYLSLREEKPGLEYVDGVVLQKPMANYEHTSLAGELIISLGLYARQHGGRTGPENRVRMGDLPNYRLPDVSYWAPEAKKGDDSIPTLAIEIRSPDQTMLELRQKCREFRRAGVQVCWLVDPRSRTVEVFEGDMDGAVLAQDASLSSPALPGFELPLPQLFAVLDS